MWAVNLFITEFSLALGFAIVIYFIWRMSNPGKKW